MKACTSLMLAVVLAACNKNASEEAERERDPTPYPQIITSDQPPQRNERSMLPTPAAAPTRRRGQSVGSAAGNANEPRQRPTSGIEEIDDDYEQEGGATNEAFAKLMHESVDPFGPAPTPVDIPLSGPMNAKNDSANADKPKKEWLLACMPRMPIRKQANNVASVVAKVAVGAKLQPVKQRDADEPASGWIQVDAGHGVRGWVSERNAHRVVEGQEGVAYLECCNVARDADDGVSDPKEKFAERLDFLTCIERAVGEIGDGPTAGDLQVARAVALNRVAELVVRSDKPLEQPYRGFMQRYGDQLAWDPEGYATKSGEMWALEEKFHNTPAGDALAWQAAAFSALDRSCHHEVACAVSQARLHYGEYLKRYPDGAHASEACDAIAELRPRSATDNSLQMDRNAQRVEQCLSTIDQLNGIVQSTHAVGRVQALGTLEGLRRFVLERSGHLQTTR